MQKELIDTLWNVNKIPQLAKGTQNWELIDTLWNVNEKENADQMADRLRINRYIMECKSFYLHPLTFPTLRELIDTLWNVNSAPFALSSTCVS